MKKILFLFALLAAVYGVSAQSNVDLRADSVRVYKNGGTVVLTVKGRTMTQSFQLRSGGAFTGDFTIPSNNASIYLGGITADRTVTFPALSATLDTSVVMLLYNLNVGGFVWNVAGTVQEANGTVITSIPNGTLGMYAWVGNKWVHLSTGNYSVPGGDTLLARPPLYIVNDSIFLALDELPADTCFANKKVGTDSVFNYCWYTARGVLPAYRDSSFGWVDKGASDLILATAGVSGAATWDGTTLNIPNYSLGSTTWSGVISGTSYSGTNTTIPPNASVQFIFTGSSPATFTLPDRASNANEAVFIKNEGSATLTVSRQGSDQLYSSAAVTSVTLEAGTAKLFMSDGFYWNAYDFGGGGFTSPMTTTGDMIYSSSGSTAARLGIGSTGQYLKVVGGVPTWATFPTDTINVVSKGNALTPIFDWRVINNTDSIVRYPWRDTTNVNFIHADDSAITALIVPPGSNGNIMFNDGGEWGADAGGNWNKTTNKLTADTLQAITVRATNLFSGKSMTLDGGSLSGGYISEFKDDVYPRIAINSTSTGNGQPSLYFLSAFTTVANAADILGRIYAAGASSSGGEIKIAGMNTSGVEEVRATFSTTANILTHTVNNISQLQTTGTNTLQTVHIFQSEKSNGSPTNGYGAAIALAPENGTSVDRISLTLGVRYKDVTHLSEDAEQTTSIISNGAMVETRRESYNSVATTDATPTTLETIALATSSTAYFVDLFITATDASNNKNYYQRRLCVKNVSGTLTIESTQTIGTDQESGSLTSADVSFSTSSTNLLPTVTGIAATNLTWKTSYTIRPL